MISEYGKIFDPDNSTEIRFILLSNLSQDGNLKKGLLNQLLTTLRYFKSKKFFVLMVKYLQYLSKRTLVYRFYDLISISDMITFLIFVKLSNLVDMYS